MKTVKTLCLVSVLGLLPTVPALAHGDMSHDRIERRLDRQQMRIQEGVRSGELTRHEAQRLRQQHRRIVHLKRDFMSDGRLSHKERHALMERLDKASSHIYSLKHNRRDRGHRHGWYSDRHHRHGRGYRLGEGLTLYFGKHGRW